MRKTICRFFFGRDVAMDDVESSVLVAIFAAEGIHGAARVRLDAGYLLDRKRRVLVIDARSAVGETVAQVATGLFLREFGEDAFRAQRVPEKGRDRRSNCGCGRTRR